MNTILSGEQLVNLQAKTNYELPSSGLKEFEPNNSWLEQKQIQSALDERKALLEEERVEKWNLLMEAEWIPDRHKAEVKRKNKHWEVFGHHSDGKDWLFPEEVLYLMEMNCLECYFGEVPLSIQKGYTVLLRPESGCSVTEYRVFCHLSRAGYRVVRHLPNLTVTAYERQIRLDQHLEQKKTYSDTAVAEQQEIARPDLPPKKILELSDNVEVLIKAKDIPSNEAEQPCSEDDEVMIISPEKQKQTPKSSIEVIDLADSSEESSDSDVEIIQECPPSGSNKTIKTEDYMKCVSIYDDDGEVEIIEVPIPKKEIIVTTIETSESELEDNAMDSDSNESYDGNWKRRQPNKNRRPFIRPAQMDNFKYLSVEEFCLGKNVKNVHDGRGKENIQNGNTDNISPNEKNESLDSSESIECVSLQPQGSRGPFSVTKSRTEILDLMPSMAKQRIMSIDCPDWRLIPHNIEPKQNIYTYNTNSFKARLFSSFRPGYRGRRFFHRPMLNNYNPYFNSNNMFHSNQFAIRPSLLPNSTLTQMFGSDVQSVARGMMQFASALLNNGMLPNNQSNDMLPLSFPQNDRINRSIPHMEGFNSPGFNYQPTFDDSSNRSLSTPIHTRFSDTPAHFSDFFQQSRQSPSFRDRSETPFSSEYNQRPFTPPTRRHHEWNMNRSIRSRPFGRPHQSRHTEEFTPPGVAALDDPAYTRPDIPVREVEDRLGNKGGVSHCSNTNNKSIEIIDIDDEDVKFVPLKKGISYKFTGKRKLTKKMVQNRFGKKKKFQNMRAIKNKGSSFIFLDSPTVSSSSLDVPVKEVKETFDLSSVKTESSESVTVKQEVSQTCSQVDIKQEEADIPVKIEINVDLGQIKTQPFEDFSVKLEQNDSASDIKIDIPPVVKLEPSVPREEVVIKNEPSTETASVPVDIKVSKSVTTDPTPSTSICEQLIERDSDSQINEESIKMEICDLPVHKSELVNSVVNSSGSIGPSSSDLSRTSEDNSNVDYTKSGEKTSEVINSDTSEKVKSWAEMKKQNVPLGRTEGSEDEVDSSSEEEGDEIQPIIKPKHCKSIGTVLSALQIFSPFTPEVPETITKLKISFDMYLATDFRKAQRSLPQYRIVVFGGMDPIPNQAQFHELQTRFKDKVPLLRAVVMPNSVVFYNCTSILLPVDNKLDKT